MLGRRIIEGGRRSGSRRTCAGKTAHLLRLSFGFDRHQTGQLMSRATVDLQSVRFFLGFGLIFFFQHVLTVVSVMVVLFIVEWRLAQSRSRSPWSSPSPTAQHVSHPVLRGAAEARRPSRR